MTLRRPGRRAAEARSGCHRRGAHRLPAQPAEQHGVHHKVSRQLYSRMCRAHTWAGASIHMQAACSAGLRRMSKPSLICRGAGGSMAAAAAAHRPGSYSVSCMQQGRLHPAVLNVAPPCTRTHVVCAAQRVWEARLQRLLQRPALPQPQQRDHAGGQRRRLRCVWARQGHLRCVWARQGHLPSGGCCICAPVPRAGCCPAGILSRCRDRRLAGQGCLPASTALPSCQWDADVQKCWLQLHEPSHGRSRGDQRQGVPAGAARWLLVFLSNGAWQITNVARTAGGCTQFLSCAPCAPGA